MSVTTNSELLILWYVHLYHCWLLVYNVLDCNDNLINVFLVQFLAILESLNHVLYKLWSHLVSQLRSIVVLVDYHRVKVESFCCGWRICNLDRLEKGISLDQLLACIELCLGYLVAWLLLDYNLPVIDGLFMLKDGGIRNGSSIVGLQGVRSHA